GGAAAWVNREQISSGWTWVSSHLEFVGCLARAEELKKRVACMVQLGDELGVGFANLYTRLGEAAPAQQVGVVGTVLGRERTFCNLPRTLAAGEWREAVNDKAADETVAHMGEWCRFPCLPVFLLLTSGGPAGMFEPGENPGYAKLSEDAAGLIAKWSDNDWYESSSEVEPQKAQGAA
ncbi:Uncharacterized protein TCAP_06256, partial [Tolypocladium capitatum]